MTTALSADQRTVLEKKIQAARRLVEDDLADGLEGRFGIHTSGRIESADSLELSPSTSAVRSDLVEIVEFLRSEGEDAVGSVERLVREAAFTHLNRLVAVRVAEAIGLLPETIGRGVASSGFRDFSELAPTVAETEWGRFAVFVRLCADELATDVPALFDPRNPLLELELSEPVLRRVVESIAAIDDMVWAAPDTLGWAYQFFNTGEERREMRESSAPRNSRELAVRNQFFTPSYVVEFLVHNGLGAHLAAGFPELAEELPLLVEVPSERVDVDLESVSVLDPACGSGHFLLGAYDVLEKAWALAGVDANEAAPLIVESLWGIDIDPRATQIAQAAVIFRARRHCRGPLPTPNVICARALPAGPEIDELIESLPTEVGRAVRAIAGELVDAPVLGPLLKVEERLSHEVRDVFGTGVIEGTLSEAPGVEVENIEAAVLEALSSIADSTTSTAPQRLFAAEAHDAVRFVEAMSRRYTTVLMNPPFGEPVASTKKYLKSAYPWMPKNYDLATAFVGRGLELAGTSGTVSCVMPRNGLFLRTSEKWREVTVLRHLSTLADLGLGVMEQALVEACAFSLSARPRADALFLRLLNHHDPAATLPQLTSQARASSHDSQDVFRVRLSDFRSIPTSPLSYWMPAEARNAFSSRPAVGDSTADFRVGLQTSDDFRFIRAHWEVAPGSVGQKRQEFSSGQKRWAHLAKGGEYSPMWADIHLVVNWEDDGQEIKDFISARYPYLDGKFEWVVKNIDDYFRPGVTWPERTASSFCPQLLPPGCIISVTGPGALTEKPAARARLLATLSHRLSKAFMSSMVGGGEGTSSGAAARHYTVGAAGRLPSFGSEAFDSDDEAHEWAQRVVQLGRCVGWPDETSTTYDASEYGSLARVGFEDWCDSLLREQEDAALELIERTERVDLTILASLGLDADGEFLRAEERPALNLYPTRRLDVDAVANLIALPIDDLISRCLADGGARYLAVKSYVADRRLELIAHHLGARPSDVVEARRSTSTLPDGFASEAASRLLSYLVGCVFGRWEAGEHTTASHDPFSTLPSLPPARADLDGPVVLSGIGLAGGVAAHAVALAGESGDGPLASAVEVVGGRSLSAWLERSFFKSHLSRYSRSRRKAPIYWQLQVPSRAWGLWLYAPKLSRELLFAVVREAEQRQRLADQQIGRLQREAETGGGGRSASDVAKELDAEQSLSVELATFRAEAERIANLGWEPDLDDGMVLNAAPLADLFPAWKDAAKYRDELRAGKYEWATVARYADQL